MRSSTERRGRGLRWALLALLGTQALAGCQSWRETSLSPHALFAEERPGSIRVTLEDGRVATFRNPTLVSDTIVGTGDAGTEKAAAEQVRGLEVRRTSVPRTVALVLGNVSAFVTAIALIIEVQPHY